MISRDSSRELNKLFSGISLFICAVLVIGMLFSSFFVATEHNHHCQGEDCPICQMVAMCESFLDQVGAGMLIYAVAILAALFITSIGLLPACNLTAPTLVSQKVRLNN